MPPLAVMQPGNLVQKRGKTAGEPLEPRKKPSYFPLYWLVNRDPYYGLLQSLYNWVVITPPIYTKQPGFFSLLTWRMGSQDLL